MRGGQIYTKPIATKGLAPFAVADGLAIEINLLRLGIAETVEVEHVLQRAVHAIVKEYPSGVDPSAAFPNFRIYGLCGGIDLVVPSVDDRIAVEIMDEFHDALLQLVFRADADVTEHGAGGFCEELGETRRCP